MQIQLNLRIVSGNQFGKKGKAAYPSRVRYGEKAANES